MKFKQIKYFALAFLLASIFLTGCLKDGDAPGAENYSHSPALVGFQYTGSSFAPAIVAILGTPNDSFAIKVTMSVASLTLSTPVTATIAPDQATLDAFNVSNSTDYVQLPLEQYTIVGGSTVTINPGQQTVSFAVHFAGDKINFDTSNALALKITSATGATIASNLNTYVMQIKLRSIYEGIYDQDGILNRYTGPVVDPAKYVDNFPISGSFGFTTVTSNSIEGQIVIPGFAATYTKLTVDPATNIVTISPSAIAPSNDMKNQAGKTSTYDPSTNTFDIHGQFLNAAGNLRLFDFTMVLQ